MISFLQFENLVPKGLIQKRNSKVFNLLVALLFLSQWAFSQNLTISSSGQTGTKGNNWNFSGAGLTIRNGDAIIHPQVIEKELNPGNLYFQIIDVLNEIRTESKLDYISLNQLTINAQRKVAILDPIRIPGRVVQISVTDENGASSSVEVNSFIDVCRGKSVKGNIFMYALELFILEKPMFSAGSLTSAGNILVGEDWQGGVYVQDRISAHFKINQTTKVTTASSVGIDASAKFNVIVWVANLVGPRRFSHAEDLKINEGLYGYFISSKC